MRVGFIGLGNMGTPMSAQLVAHGYEVWGYDLLPEAMERAAGNGVHPAANSREVAEKCDRIVCIMPQTACTKEAIVGKDGAAEALRLCWPLSVRRRSPMKAGSSRRPSTQS